MTRYLAPLGIFILLGVLLWQGLARDPRKLPSVLIGKPFPAFSLSAVDDAAQAITQEALKGRAALVNVWATWCVSCRAEHKFLNDLAKQGVVIHGINYKDDRAEAQTWLRELGNPYTISIFEEHGRLGIDLGMYGTPETFVIDKNGVIQYRHAGPLSQEVWDATVKAEWEKWQ